MALIFLLSEYAVILNEVKDPIIAFTRQGSFAFAQDDTRYKL